MNYCLLRDHDSSELQELARWNRKIEWIKLYRENIKSAHNVIMGLKVSKEEYERRYEPHRAVPRRHLILRGIPGIGDFLEEKPAD